MPAHYANSSVCQLTSSIAYLAFPVLISWAIASDLVSMQIRNWVSLSCVVLYYIAALSCGQSLPDILMNSVVALAALGLGLAAFATNSFGGGDVKLTVACVLWIGAGPLLIEFVLLTAWLGGGLAFASLYLRGVTWPPRWVGLLPEWITTRKAGIPYGFAIGNAALFIYPNLRLV